MSRAAHSVNLNKETFDLLCEVQKDMAEELGFTPTLGQVVRRLVNAYFGEEE